MLINWHKAKNFDNGHWPERKAVELPYNEEFDNDNVLANVGTGIVWAGIALLVILFLIGTAAYFIS